MVQLASSNGLIENNESRPGSFPLYGGYIYSCCHTVRLPPYVNRPQCGHTTCNLSHPPRHYGHRGGSVVLAFLVGSLRPLSNIHYFTRLVTHLPPPRTRVLLDPLHIRPKVVSSNVASVVILLFTRTKTCTKLNPESLVERYAK